MRACHNRTYFTAALYFALATSFRSNGILLSGFILYDLIARPVLAETASALSNTTQMTLLATSKSFLHATRQISPFNTIYSVLLTAIVLSPFAAHQYIAYASFCAESTTAGVSSLYPRPWCASRLPMIYGFVQSHYWDVGFLRYWAVAQIPNFIIAAPMLFLVGGSSTCFLWLAVHSFGRRPDDGARADDCKSNPSEARLLSPVMVLTLLPYALHALALSMVLFTSAHVQIALRVLPAATPWAAWAAAALVVKGKRVDETKRRQTVDRQIGRGEEVQGNQEVESEEARPDVGLRKRDLGAWWTSMSHAWIGWSVIWVFVSCVLWLAFLPPA